MSKSFYDEIKEDLSNEDSVSQEESEESPSHKISSSGLNNSKTVRFCYISLFTCFGE